MTPSTKPQPRGAMCGRNHRHASREQVAECDRRLAERTELLRVASAKQEGARDDQTSPV